MFGEYNRVARIYPAIISAVPIFVLNYFLLQGYTSGFIISLEKIEWIGGVTISVAFVFLFAQIGRFIGKELFEKAYFKDELYMPTTNFLLHSDSTYSPEHTSRLHKKILNDFGIHVYTIAQENQNTTSARRIVVESVSMIRGKVKNGQLLLQHNIEYGFVRNLIGGSLPALFFSIVNIYIFGFLFQNKTAFVLSIFTTVFYFLLIAFSKYLVKQYGVRYAKILIQEYLLS